MDSVLLVDCVADASLSHCGGQLGLATEPFLGLTGEAESGSFICEKTSLLI